MKTLPVIALVALAFANQPLLAQTAYTDAVVVPQGIILPENFGRAVDVDGDFAVVGAPRGSNPASFSGAAYVLERAPSGAWVEVQRLVPSIAGFLAHSGLAVAIDGERIVVASPWWSFVAVFERQPNGTWSEVALVQAPDPTLSGFGQAVALQGDRLFVCAPTHAQGTPGGLGYVCVYERDALGVWQLVASALPDPISAGMLGDALAADGDRMAIGVPAANSTSPILGSAGAVIVFERQSNGTWSRVAVLQAAVPEANARLGESLVLRGDMIIAGAPDALSSGTTKGGAVFVFERDAFGVWSQVGRLIASNHASGDAFGTALALEDDVLVVGAETSDLEAADSGAAYVFDRSSAGQFQERAVISPRAAPGGWGFGAAVALENGRALIGAPGASFPPPIGVVTTVGAVHDFEIGSLYHGANVIELASGGSQDLLLRGPLSTAGDGYFVLGSASGTTPAIPLAPGVDLPLVFDAYTDLALWLAIPVAGQFGVLDASGSANAAFNVPAGTHPSFAGLVLHHAYIAIDFMTFEVFASNAARVELAP